MSDWHQEARDMRQRGYGVEDIAVKFHVTISAVYKLLTRDRADEPTPLKNTDTENRVREAYFMNPELGTIGIAHRLKLETGMVRAILERAGLPEAKGADE